jgi:uncharacterized membrane protein
MRLSAFFLLLLTFAYATTVYGEIVNPETFEQLNSTVIKIKGPTTTQFVADGNYSVELAEGNYTIIAYYLENGKIKYYTNENLSVVGKEIRFDIVPLPTDFQRVYELENFDFELPTQPKEEKTNLLVIVAFVIIVIIAALLFYKKKGEEREKDEKKAELDEDGRRVLDLIEKYEGRITQKELREILKWSEAKTSLVIAELEVLGKIRRIKKGRENILKLITK